METGLVKLILAVWGIATTIMLTLAGWLFKRVIEKHDAEMTKLNSNIICLGKKMDERAHAIEERLEKCVSHETYEQNRREVSATYTQIFEKLERIGGAVMRIEGRMEKRA
jgi:hypothetical protein